MAAVLIAQADQLLQAVYLCCCCVSGLGRGDRDRLSVFVRNAKNDSVVIV